MKTEALKGLCLRSLKFQEQFFPQKFTKWMRSLFQSKPSQNWAWNPLKLDHPTWFFHWFEKSGSFCWKQLPLHPLADVWPPHDYINKKGLPPPTPETNSNSPGSGKFSEIREGKCTQPPAFGAIARLLETFLIVVRGSQRFNWIFSPASV